ncbi:MAG: site-specific integrase, partial [Terriglobales bacterium]
MTANMEKAVSDFIRALRERNASPHTIAAYGRDLGEFSAFIGPHSAPAAVDHLRVRAFLSHLYDRGLGKTSVARSLAAVRSLYRWLARNGAIEQNPA